MSRLELVNGLPRMKAEPSSVVVYDQTLLVVASGAGAGQINGPIAAGVPVTLPSAKTYTDVELEVYINDLRLVPTYDYSYYSGTQVAFTFELITSDLIRFRIDRT